MDNRAPPDNLLSVAVSSPTARNDLAEVYRCMHTQRSTNPVLGNYDDVDKVRQLATVLHADDGTAHLVYHDDHPSMARTEVTFDVAGYIVAFNLPGQYIPKRLLYRPHSLRQRVVIVADEDPDFAKAMESVAAVKAVFDQFGEDAITNQFGEDAITNQCTGHTLFGLESLEANTGLFTHETNRGIYPVVELPSYIDPTGYITKIVGKRLFCHTTDNAVQYGETDSASMWAPQGDFLSPEYSSSSGTFRHGQLVKMTVTIRSVKRTSKGCAFRNLQVGLKKLILVGRNTEMSLLKLRMEDQKQKDIAKGTAPKMFRRPRQILAVPMATKEEYVRDRLASMSFQGEGEAGEALY